LIYSVPFMTRLEAAADSVVEAVSIAKTVLGTVWFWIPIAYALYFIVQLWLIFYIHPLTAIVAATLLGVYALYLEGKRTASRYSLKVTLRLSATHSFTEGPKPLRAWEVEETVEEYERLLENRRPKKR
jgi:hypothetical protein